MKRLVFLAVLTAVAVLAGCDDSKRITTNNTVVECCDSCAALEFENCVLRQQVGAHAETIRCFNDWVKENEHKLRKHHIKLPFCVGKPIVPGGCEN